MKNFFPEYCPECNTKLKIESGKSSDVIKLICPNIDCSGSKLKKLEKGIIGLEIRGLGPAVIKKLSLSGIENAYDLFNKDIFNEKTLCASGEFKKGRALEKIIDAVNSVKEISIDKAILSLQLQDIGKTLSLQIGRYLSGVKYSFDGLNIRVRTDIIDKNSELYLTITESLKKFEDYGVNIIKETKKENVVVTKKITKKVYFYECLDNELLDKLGWTLTTIDKCDVMAVNEKTPELEKIANENNSKLLTLKQIKLLFL